MRNGDSEASARLPAGERVPRMISIVLLFSLGAIVESVRLFSLRNPEIWVHLRLGSWILKHKSWPQVGLFSQAANFPWRDFSWGYDMVVAVAYQLIGLRSVPVLQMVFCVALAGITFLLAGSHRGQFWSAVVLSAVAQFVLSDMGPIAAGASVVLFGVELLLLLEIRRSGNRRLLFVFPLLFLLWTNVDTGFVYGIGLYALFLAALAAEKIGRVTGWNWIESAPKKIPLRSAAWIACASVVSSVVSPYGYHGYAAFFADQVSAANRYLPGYTAMSFHQPRDYALLLLAMSAFLALGMRRSRDLFQLGLLVACAALSFHAQRESWLATMATVSVIGEAVSRKGEEVAIGRRPRRRKTALASVGVALVLVSLAFTLLVPHEQHLLLAKIADSFPVRACDAIRQRQLPQPLFNSYGWGSFLMWYLPEYPVAIDERRGLYPGEEELKYFKVMNGDLPYQSLPTMQQARTLLLDKQNVMSDALRGLPGFQVAYEDRISIVLIHEGQ